MIAFVLKYRKLIGYAIAALLLISLVLAWRHSLISDGIKLGREQVRKEWANSIMIANREISIRDAKYAALQGERDKAKAEVEAIRNRPIPAPRTLIVEVPTNAPVSTRPHLGPDFLRSYNAAADAADSH